MANYKKLTDVEVMEEVSENTMALVDENGTLKKVPCGAGFGGTAAIIEFTFSIASPAEVDEGGSGGSFVCNNMTHSDIVSSLQNNVFVNVVAIGSANDGVLYQSVANTLCYIFAENIIGLSFENMPFTYLYWYSDDTISTEPPIPETDA